MQFDSAICQDFANKILTAVNIVILNRTILQRELSFREVVRTG